MARGKTIAVYGTRVSCDDWPLISTVDLPFKSFASTADYSQEAR